MGSCQRPQSSRLPCANVCRNTELDDTEKVSRTWTTQNGVNGRRFTDIATGNNIFLPTAGIAMATTAHFNYPNDSVNIGAVRRFPSRLPIATPPRMIFTSTVTTPTGTASSNYLDNRCVQLLLLPPLCQAFRLRARCGFSPIR